MMELGRGQGDGKEIEVECYLLIKKKKMFLKIIIQPWKTKAKKRIKANESVNNVI